MSAKVVVKGNLIVPCTGRGEGVTHARLRHYAFYLEIAYGRRLANGGWKTVTWEVLPYRSNQELRALRDKEGWVKDEVVQMFDLADEEQPVAATPGELAIVAGDHPI
jgi:hypothetical protein